MCTGCYSPIWLGSFVGQKASLCGNTQGQRESAEGAPGDSTTVWLCVKRMLACIVSPLSLSAACMCSAYMSIVCVSLSLTEWGLYFPWGRNAHTPECARVHIRTHRACDQTNRTLTRFSSSYTNTHIYTAHKLVYTGHVTPCLNIHPTSAHIVTQTHFISFLRQ